MSRQEHRPAQNCRLRSPTARQWPCAAMRTILRRCSCLQERCIGAAHLAHKHLQKCPCAEKHAPMSTCKQARVSQQGHRPENLPCTKLEQWSPLLRQPNTSTLQHHSSALALESALREFLRAKGRLRHSPAFVKVAHVEPPKRDGCINILQPYSPSPAWALPGALGQLDRYGLRALPGLRKGD